MCAIKLFIIKSGFVLHISAVAWIVCEHGNTSKRLSNTRATRWMAENVLNIYGAAVKTWGFWSAYFVSFQFDQQSRKCGVEKEKKNARIHQKKIWLYRRKPLKRPQHSTITHLICMRALGFVNALTYASNAGRLRIFFSYKNVY